MVRHIELKDLNRPGEDKLVRNKEGQPLWVDPFCDDILTASQTLANTRAPAAGS